jgi:eukaryotic translation initiation factor 2C
VRNEPRQYERLVEEFQMSLEREAQNLGIPIRLCKPNHILVEGNRKDLSQAFADLKRCGARFVVVLLVCDVYALVKFSADSINLPTQCVRWQNLSKPPRNYHTSLMVKINGKIGGVNHTLASRASKREQESLKEESFQFPPKSISWLFEEHCMVMGVDVNHPEVGVNSSTGGGPSVAAVVASMDGKLGQYCAHISTCASREEPVEGLGRAVGALFDSFCSRNGGNMPKRIIIYRDGVSDNQFEKVLEKVVVVEI